MNAHRVAYGVFYGRVPAGSVVRHTCDNPPCCNPAHLLLGTHADNMRDMKERGRARNGPNPARLFPHPNEGFVPVLITPRIADNDAICACPHCDGKFRLADNVDVDRKPLTSRQFTVYEYMYRYSAEKGFVPSFDEIAAAFGFSSLATVHEHLSNLERKGYLVRRYNESRGATCLVPLNEVKVASMGAA